jgi:hypothetical protein
MALTVTYDTSAVQAMLARLPAELRDKASQLAVNKTAAKAKTEMRRQITAVYNLKAAEVGGALFVRPASLKQNLMSAALYPTTLSGKKKGRAMNVIHFLEGKTTLGEAKKRGKAGTLEQLFFKFKKTGGKKSIPRVGAKSAPFVGNLGRTVFRRTGKPSAKNARIEGIEPVQVIDIPQMFNTAALNNAVLKKAAADLLIETDRAVAQVLRTLA